MQTRRDIDRRNRNMVLFCLMVVAACLMLAFCQGCTPTLIVKGYCVPESIYSAWTWEARTGNPARIAVSRIDLNTDHAQAQGWTGERWVFLTSLNGEVREWEAHQGLERPYRFVGLDQWIEEQRKERRP